MEGRHEIMAGMSRAAPAVSGKKRMTVDWFGQAGVGGFTGWRDDRWEQVRHYKGWVYVAISRIMNTVSQVTPTVSVCKADSSSTTTADKTKHQRALVHADERELLTAVPSSHRLVRLFNDPNDPDVWDDIAADMVMYFELVGTVYLWAVPDKFGLPEQLIVLPSHWVWPLVDQNRQLVGYDLRPTDGSSVNGGWIPKKDVIVFKKRSPFSKWDGHSPLTAGSTWVDCSDAVDRARWHAFRNGINTDIAFEFDEEYEPENDEEYAQLRVKIDSHYAGVEKSKKALLVPPGMKVKPLGFKIREADFGGSFEQIARAVLALFGVPPVVAGLGDTGAYGNHIASLASFAHHCINPLLSYFGHVITEKLARRFDEKLRVWWPDQTVPDPMIVEQQLRTDGSVGARTINEQRGLRGLPPVSWGEERARVKSDTSGKRAQSRDQRKDENKDGSTMPDSVNGHEVK